MRSPLLLGFLGLATAAAAAPQTFSSGPRQVTLLELYSSEGCSSCPPAEAWLNDRLNDPRLWKTFVPLEFHVNYWDKYGWADRLSTRAFTVREYDYADAWGKPNYVYTPCFVMNGAEYRPDRGDPSPAMPPAGELTAEVGPDGTCQVSFQALPGAADKYEVAVALLGTGLSSHPDAGENRGATLHHDFVVIGLEHARLGAEGGGGHFTASLHLPAPIITDATRRAVAVWVTRHGSLVPVQATGGWLL